MRHSRTCTIREDNSLGAKVEEEVIKVVTRQMSKFPKSLTFMSLRRTVILEILLTIMINMHMLMTHKTKEEREAQELVKVY